MSAPSPRIGVYPGTFDPITKGHMDVVRRALQLVDHLVIAIAEDIPKTPIFDLQTRAALVEKDIKHEQLESRVDVRSFPGLLVDFVEEQGASLIIRGLRAVSDFEYEFQLAAMNSRLKPELQTVFLPASENKLFLASRLVKEVARLGGDVSDFVSVDVARALQDFYRK